MGLPTGQSWKLSIRTKIAQCPADTLLTIYYFSLLADCGILIKSRACMCTCMLVYAQVMFVTVQFIK